LPVEKPKNRSKTLKMSLLKDIIKVLEAVAPPSIQESFDNSGLQIGDVNQPIVGVLLTVDVNEAVIDEAISKKANLIVAHHPLIFKGIKKLTESNYVERSVVKAIRHGIAIYAMHTNLDLIQGGVSYRMAQKLGLNRISTLAPSGQLKKLVVYVPVAHQDKLRKALFSAGAGHIGQYDSCSFNLEGKGTFRAQEGAVPYVGQLGELHTENEVRIETIFPKHLQFLVVEALKNNHPYEEVAYDIYSLEQTNAQIGLGAIGYLPHPMPEIDFLHLIKEKFALKHFRYTHGSDRIIEKVAVCGGSCSFLISNAMSKADAFVSSDIKYHEFFDVEHRMLVADIGHYESELDSKTIFYEIICEKFSNFAVHFSEVNTNPINFL